jgi:predicted MPP superfamily phosphohydrolase
MFRLILIAIVIADIAWWWRADTLARRSGRPWLRLGVAAFMAVQLGLILWIFVSRWVGAAFPSPPALVMTAVYAWHLLVLPVLIVTVLPWNVARGTWKGALGVRAWMSRRRPTAGAEGAGVQDDPRRLSRRDFLATAAVAAPPIATLAVTGYSPGHLQDLRVRRIEVPVAELPPELDGLRIAHVSDLHVGTFTDDRLLRRIVESTSALDADLIVLPGDLINNRLSDLPAALDAVNNMQARHAKVLCIGNHDLIENGHEFVRRARERVDLPIQESRSVIVRGREVQVMGLDWSRGEERIAASVREIAKQVRPGAFPVLLAHHPHAFDAAAEAGIPLTLSGHTHGGQLMMSEDVGFGPAMFRYWSGLYRKDNGSSLVVSNGAGHWYPVRVAAPAEVVEVVVRRA